MKIFNKEGKQIGEIDDSYFDDPLTKKPKQWECKEGEWCLDYDGVPMHDESVAKATNIATYQSEEAAQRAADLRTPREILNQAVNEFNISLHPDKPYVADWGDEHQTKHYALYNYATKEWIRRSSYLYRIEGIEYGSGECIDKLMSMLNSNLIKGIGR